MNINAPQPTVLISFSHDGAEAPPAFRDMLWAGGERVRLALESLGMGVRLVNAAHPDFSEDGALAGASGLIVLGGADIDPTSYGQEREADNLYYLDSAADAYEIGLVQRAVERQVPVFGVCRGLQVANVALGGTVVQDLGEGFHNASVVGNPFSDHAIRVEPNSRLAQLMGSLETEVRTGHHQAAAELGRGLTAVAYAEDGVIEAIESEEPWILGVQWHPEESAADPAAMQRLLSGFVDAVLARHRGDGPDPAR